MIPIKDHKNFFRDEKSGAVINGDSTGFAHYKKIKLLKLTQKEEIDNIIEYISVIKVLLKQFLNK